VANPLGQGTCSTRARLLRRTRLAFDHFAEACDTRFRSNRSFASRRALRSFSSRQTAKPPTTPARWAAAKETTMRSIAEAFPDARVLLALDQDPPGSKETVLLDFVG